MEKLLFFWAAMARLGKYCTGGYGRIVVYRVNESISLSSSKSYMRGEIGYVNEVNLVRK